LKIYKGEPGLETVEMALRLQIPNSTLNMSKILTQL
jgi:hypothetical protein